MEKNTAKKKEDPAEEELTGRADDRPLHERIAERAYELHRTRGEHHGYDLDDWLEAERMILSKQSDQKDVTDGSAAPLKSKPASRARATRKRGGERKAASE